MLVVAVWLYQNADNLRFGIGRISTSQLAILGLSPKQTGTGHWKDEFPSDWQEVVHTNLRTNEKHIADVQTADGLTIEFQHSLPRTRRNTGAAEVLQTAYLDHRDAQPESDSTNARFFKMGLGAPVCSNPKAYTLCWYSQSKLLHKWGEPEIDAHLDFRHPGAIWRLMDFDGDAKGGLVIPVDRDQLASS